MISSDISNKASALQWEVISSECLNWTVNCVFAKNLVCCINVYTADVLQCNSMFLVWKMGGCCILFCVALDVLLNSDVQPDESGRPAVVSSASFSSSSSSVRYMFRILSVSMHHFIAVLYQEVVVVIFFLTLSVFLYHYLC